jgi:hypothetical protein
MIEQIFFASVIVPVIAVIGVFPVTVTGTTGVVAVTVSGGAHFSDLALGAIV